MTMTPDSDFHVGDKVVVARVDNIDNRITLRITGRKVTFTNTWADPDGLIIVDSHERFPFYNTDSDSTFGFNFVPKTSFSGDGYVVDSYLVKDTTPAHPLLDILRRDVELKQINQLAVRVNDLTRDTTRDLDEKLYEYQAAFQSLENRLRDFKQTMLRIEARRDGYEINDHAKNERR